MSDNQHKTKDHQRTVEDMYAELDDLPKYMTKLRGRITKDLIRSIPLLLRRIYYLEQQVEKTANAARNSPKS